MSHSKQVTSLIFTEQRRPTVIFVAADVGAVQSRFPDVIQGFNMQGQI